MFESPRQETAFTAAGVAGEREVFVAGVGFPDAEAAVAVGGREQHAVGAELDGEHPVGVLRHLMQHLAGLGRVNLHDPLRAAEGDAFVIGADVGGEHGIEFLADFEHALAGRDVPDDDLAARGRPAAAGEQQSTIAAEANHVRLTFGKWIHADQVERCRVVEQHLALAGDGNERRPRTRGKRTGHRRVRHLERRFQHHARRHWNHVGPFAGR